MSVINVSIPSEAREAIFAEKGIRRRKFLQNKWQKIDFNEFRTKNAEFLSKRNVRFFQHFRHPLDISLRLYSPIMWNYAPKALPRLIKSRISTRTSELIRRRGSMRYAFSKLSRKLGSWNSRSRNNGIYRIYSYTYSIRIRRRGVATHRYTLGKFSKYL